MVQEVCPLTKRALLSPRFRTPEFNGFYFDNPDIGVYGISDYALDSINKYEKKLYIIIGYIKNHNKKDAPIEIDTLFLDDIDQFNFPNDYKKKRNYLLRYIYQRSGENRKPFNLRTPADYSICYSEDLRQFNDIMKDLREKGYINFQLKRMSSRNDLFYREIVITDLGEEYLFKKYPSLLMQDLLRQEIILDDEKQNKKLNHARKLFLNPDATFEDKRSACLEIISLIEPHRTFLQKKIGKQDIDIFFEIVNRFDVRHNKKNILHIELPEQLEWIYFSFLNTLNLYTKLSKRFAPEMEGKNR